MSSVFATALPIAFRATADPVQDQNVYDTNGIPVGRIYVEWVMLAAANQGLSGSIALRNLESARSRWASTLRE
jgi:hypothetical protein